MNERDYRSESAALREASSEIQHLLEGADVGTLFLDDRLRVRKVTARAARLFRIGPEDLGRDIRDLATEGTAGEGVLESIESVLTDGRRVEHEVFGDEGATYLLRITPYRPLTSRREASHDERGGIAGVVLTITDITSLGKARLELARAMALFDSTDDAIIGEDLSGVITMWNRGAERLYGYSSDEVLGKPFHILVPGGRGAEMERVLQELRRGDRVDPMEVFHVSKDGSTIAVSLTLSPIFDRDGRVIGASSIARDTGPLWRAKQALMERESRIRLLLDSTAEAIYGIDMDGRCTFANRSCARMLGLETPEELIGKGMHALIHHRHADGTPYPMHDCKIYRAFRENLHVHVDSEVFWRANGEPFPVEYWSYPIVEKGDVTGAVVTFLDVTERRRAEQQMRVETQRREQFLAMLSHELRNPLAAVLNAAELIEASGDATVVRAARDIVERQARHMSRLLDDLLDTGRIARGAIDLRLEVMDLRLAVGHALEAVAPLCEERALQLRLDLTDDALPVHGDPARLQQVAANLLSNAARYSAPQATVSVRTFRQGANAVLAVKDDGRGIEPELLPYVFDLFVQGERELHRSDGGIGVGLTLAKGLVELHGGDIRAHSLGKDQGSEFVVTIPLAAAPDARAVPSADPAPAERNVGVPRRIVVVEDQEDARVALRMVLERRGHVVTEADDGRAGLRAIEQHRPDVALIDIGLPELDGFEVARAIRAQPHLRDVKLVALSGYGSEADVRQAKEAGFDAHLTKPASQAALDRIIVSS